MGLNARTHVSLKVRTQNIMAHVKWHTCLMKLGIAKISQIRGVGKNMAHASRATFSKPRRLETEGRQQPDGEEGDSGKWFEGWVGWTDRLFQKPASSPTSTTTFWKWQLNKSRLVSLRVKTYWHSWHLRNIRNNINQSIFLWSAEHHSDCSLHGLSSSVLRSGLWVTLQPQLKHLQTDGAISSAQIASAPVSVLPGRLLEFNISCWHVITSFLSFYLKVLDLKSGDSIQTGDEPH